MPIHELISIQIEFLNPSNTCTILKLICDTLFTKTVKLLMDGTNNASKSIKRSLKKSSSCGSKNLYTVFRSIQTFKTDKSKRMLCATKQRKRSKKNVENLIRLMKFCLMICNLVQNYHQSVQLQIDLAPYEINLKLNKFKRNRYIRLCICNCKI